MKTLLLLAALGLCTLAAQDPTPPTPTAEHAWLQQLVGEWTVKSEATMAPGAEPMKSEGTESVRSLGGLWILAEGKATWGGGPLTWILTVGYDPQQKLFVGTWIDSMQTHLWSYKGKLDEAKKVLTLDTEGPSFSDPTKMAPYRDAIEIVSADHRRMTSSLRGEDGTWTTFMKADHQRKK